MSATEPRVRRLAGADGGSAALTFALLLPALVTLSVGTLEMVLMAFDFHRATEATRYVGREAAIAPPVPDLTGLTEGEAIVCTAQSGTLSCGDAAIENAAVFDELGAALAARLPQADDTSLSLRYANTGLGDAESPGGILPVVTVRLAGVAYTFRAMQVVPGVPDSVSFPPFSTTQVAGGRDPA